MRACSPIASRRRTLQQRGVLSLARERGERGREADALRLLGDVAPHRKRFDATGAGGNYLEALASELGMHRLVAH